VGAAELVMSLRLLCPSNDSKYFQRTKVLESRWSHHSKITWFLRFSRRFPPRVRDLGTPRNRLFCPCPFRLTIRVLVGELRTVAGRALRGSDADNGQGATCPAPM